MPTPALPDPAPSPALLIPAQAQYHAIQALTVGDIATLYRATGASGAVVIKLANEPADNPWLQNEADTLRALAGEAKQYGQHLPVLRDQFRTQDNRLANVLAPCEGYDLVALRQRFPQGVEPRHVIWIFRRVLSVLGYVHEQGILHGNIEPAHIIVRPQDHNVWLIDWCYAITRPRETGATFRALNAHYSAPEVAERKAPLPAADLYSLGLTMLYLLGGDPLSQTFPPSVPERLQRFVQFFLKPSAIQRPQEAWKMAHTLETIRAELFGPHQFVEFKVDS
jgi:serine/threonine protein kinase